MDPLRIKSGGWSVERREERAEPDRSVAVHIDRDGTTEKDTEESVASAIHPLANLTFQQKKRKYQLLCCCAAAVCCSVRWR